MTGMTFPAEECHVAIDLGATSGRVMLGRFNGRTVRLEEMYRFTNETVSRRGGRFWDWPRLWKEIREGLERAAATGASVISVGCDSWGHDHGFLDVTGKLLEWPYAYQDKRTADVKDLVEARIAPLALQRRAAGFHVPISALHQVLATARQRPELLARARRLLFIPGLVNHALCGAMATEPCMASLTQLHDGDLAWDEALMADFGIPPALFPPIRPCGEAIGTFHPPGNASGAWEVRLAAAHDTASAFAAAPIEAPGDVVVSVGTWAMVGMEAAAPVVTPRGLQDGVGNIRLPGGRWAVMRGMLGLYHLERFIQEEGGPRAAQWAEWAATAGPSQVSLDLEELAFQPDEPFRHALARTLAEQDQTLPESPAAIARCLYESLAQAVARGARSLAALMKRDLGRIYLVGGGAKCSLLAQLLANAAQREVVTTVAEATVAGNVLVQAWGRGRLATLDELRAVVRSSWPPSVREPAS